MAGFGCRPRVEQIPYQRTGSKLPEILSPQEVSALLQATSNLKHRALLMTMYAAGLRVAEVTHLRVTDIDGQRMMIRVEQGKGRKDRYVMLSPHLRAVLQQYWRARRPTTLLFPGPHDRPLTRESVHRVFHLGRAAREHGRVCLSLLAPARGRHPSAGGGDEYPA